MIRLGLCCKFMNEEIRFRTTTARYVSSLSKKDRLAKLGQLCMANAVALRDAVGYCVDHGIGCFRVSSRILPLKTHPAYAYVLETLPEGKTARDLFVRCGAFARAHDVRLTMHPDQFVLLSSLDEEVTKKSIAELEYHAEVSEWIGADVITMHGGGGYGDKASALQRVKQRIKKVSIRVRKRLALENDDRVYAPSDLLPVCESMRLPFVYDVHHHRCLPDGMTEEQVTMIAEKTWNREPLFHISSPRTGWRGVSHQYHHAYIQVKDFPASWCLLNLTVEVEAKAKEVAIRRLRRQLIRKKVIVWDGVKK